MREPAGTGKKAAEPATLLAIYTICHPCPSIKLYINIKFFYQCVFVWVIAFVSCNRKSKLLQSFLNGGVHCPAKTKGGQKWYQSLSIFCISGLYFVLIFFMLISYSVLSIYILYLLGALERV